MDFTNIYASELHLKHSKYRFPEKDIEEKLKANNEAIIITWETGKFDLGGVDLCPFSIETLE